MSIDISQNDFPFPTNLSAQVQLYRKEFSDKQITLKPLHLTRDIKTIHKWVNKPYAQTFWQMQGSIEILYAHYEKLLQSGKCYSLMAFLKDKPVAQIDYYATRFDEIYDLYEYEDNDYGIHLLMGPNKSAIKNLTPDVMVTALSFLFSIGIQRIMGEPDAANEKANKLVQKVGFRFIRQIQMSYKTANLYEYRKEAFLKIHG
ncbi:GNAT family N-acetyltransferase [Niabella insulamsoli]|uniref:GNAT family N-acetyltransferase n=1 Tax=Niabella insulamsoli TaxID=3144874 RepID=UPI0031FDE3B3